MCRVCLRRPEVPGEPFGRCEACTKAGRRVYQFRLRLAAEGFAVAAGELSPRALREHAGAALRDYSGRPAGKPHLGANNCELVLAGKRLESIRVAPALVPQGQLVVEALRRAGERTDPAW